MRAKIIGLLLLLLLLAALAYTFTLSGLITFSAPKQPDFLSAKPEKSSVLFLGDMMFDRDIRNLATKSGGYSYLFSCPGLSDVLTGENAVVANLEGPITKNHSQSLGSKPGASDNFKFTFDPSVTDALLLANIGYVNLGNNHTLNFGFEGLAQTTAALDKAGIKYFGVPDATSSIAHIDIPQGKVALISFNEFWKPNASTTLAQIIEEKVAGNFVVVYPHWGEEYKPATDLEESLAHQFIDAGADIVIGSHPHVVQETENYKGKPIYFSLGNFIFDQWFSKETTQGLGVELTFKNSLENPDVSELHFQLNRDGRTCSI